MVTIDIGRCGWFRTERLSSQERRAHHLILGATDSGKSYYMDHQILQDIVAGHGVGVVDPHGDLIQLILRGCHANGVPPENVVLLQPADPDRVFQFNPLEVPADRDPYPYALELQEAFKKFWADSWGERMGNIIRSSSLVLAENGLTLCEFPELLTNQFFRRSLLDETENEAAREYFINRFDQLPERERRTWIESTLNKSSQFTADPYIRDILGSPASSINFRQIIDDGKILLIDLAKGRLKSNSYLLGSLLLVHLQEAFQSRVDQNLERRRPFYLYVDECQNLVSASLLEMITELRKFGLSVTLATQTLQQLEETHLTQIALNNCHCQTYFRLSHEEAKHVAPQIFPLSGKETKPQLKRSWLGPMPQSDLQYLSVSEELEGHIQALARLKKREAFFHVRGDRTAKIRTLDVPDHEVNPAELEAYRQAILGPYTAPREELRARTVEQKHYAMQMDTDSGPFKN